MTFTRAMVVWIIGLCTGVPYATYYLFFEATRDQYAALIVGVLFWIFGYWGVVGPIVSALKVHSVFRAIETAHEQGKLKEAIQRRETEDTVIELIASENRIPRFIAAKVYRLALNKLSRRNGAPGKAL